MSEPLDFGGLGDDQLVELIRAACAEAIRRGAACAAAAQSAYLTEAEKAVIARDAMGREAERIRQEEIRRCEKDATEKVRRETDRKNAEELENRERRLWAKKKGFAEAIGALGWDVNGDQLVVWVNSSTQERRVFLQQNVFGGSTYATLYVTGNSKHAPGTIEFAKRMSESFKKALPDILRAAARDWTSVKMDLGAALAWNGDSIPVQGIATVKPANEPKVEPPPQVVPPTLRREQRGDHGGWYWVCDECRAWAHDGDYVTIHHSKRCDHPDAQPPQKAA